jgi:hypothetical protein
MSTSSIAFIAPTARDRMGWAVRDSDWRWLAGPSKCTAGPLAYAVSRVLAAPSTFRYQRPDWPGASDSHASPSSGSSPPFAIGSSRRPHRRDAMRVSWTAYLLLGIMIGRWWMSRGKAMIIDAEQVLCRFHLSNFARHGLGSLYEWIVGRARRLELQARPFSKASAAWGLAAAFCGSAPWSICRNNQRSSRSSTNPPNREAPRQSGAGVRAGRLPSNVRMFSVPRRFV